MAYYHIIIIIVVVVFTNVKALCLSFIHCLFRLWLYLATPFSGKTCGRRQNNIPNDSCFIILYFPFRALRFSCYSVNQQMHTLRSNYNSVVIRQMLLASVLTGPSSGGAQLHKTIVEPFHHLQYV